MSSHDPHKRSNFKYEHQDKRNRRSAHQIDRVHNALNFHRYFLVIMRDFKIIKNVGLE